MEEKYRVKKHEREKMFVAWLWYHHRGFPVFDRYQPIYDVQY